MKACIFVGPTLSAAAVRAELDAVVLPPAQRGDVVEAVSLLRPGAIGIIDGYFQWAAAVWHKEILWALQQGVEVFGAASMGALRAAELAAFGMRGVGRIFEAYRDGCLAESDDVVFEDDDEVAVVHGPAELGYPPASEAMVNIRLTLARALREGVIGATTAARLGEIAKGAFFPDRSYRAVLAQARRQRLAEAELRAFARWLPSGVVDQKRDDALALLRLMRTGVAAGRRASPPEFAFEHTTYWQQMLVDLEARPALDEDDALALAELRLERSTWQAMHERALASLVGADADAVAALPGSARQLAAARARRSRAAVVDSLALHVIERQMLQEAKADRSFERLRDRGRAKRRCLADSPSPGDVDSLTEHQWLELTDWFFTTIVRSEIPDDLAGWIAETGYADEGMFHAAVFDEFRFRQAACREER